jgi:hypothetical protein
MTISNLKGFIPFFVASFFLYCGAFSQSIIDEKVFYLYGSGLWQRSTLINFKEDIGLGVEDADYLFVQIVKRNYEEKDFLESRTIYDPYQISVRRRDSVSLEAVYSYLRPQDEASISFEGATRVLISSEDKSINTLNDLMDHYANDDLFLTYSFQEFTRILPGEDILLDHILVDLSPFWMNLYLEDGGKMSWFGELYDLYYPFIYHYEFGWISICDWGRSIFNDLHLWYDSPGLGLVYTDRQVFPNLFSYDYKSWFFYLPNSGKPEGLGWYYNFSSSKWEQY